MHGQVWFSGAAQCLMRQAARGKGGTDQSLSLQEANAEADLEWVSENLGQIATKVSNNPELMPTPILIHGKKSS